MSCFDESGAGVVAPRGSVGVRVRVVFYESCVHVHVRNVQNPFDNTYYTDWFIGILIMAWKKSLYNWSLLHVALPHTSPAFDMSSAFSFR